MARVVGNIYMSHGTFTILGLAGGRSFRSNVPIEGPAELEKKAERAARAIAKLRVQLVGMNPDIFIIFGDDAAECFDFSNFPTLSLFAGESFGGYEFRNVPALSAFETKPSNEADTVSGGDNSDLHHEVRGHPALAEHLLKTLLSTGFDPAFSRCLPSEKGGMSHAIMRSLQFLGRFDIPTVPILLNVGFAPQILASRCYEIGRAVRQGVDSFAGDARVVVIGSGGLWHTPGRPESYLDAGFDRSILSYLEKGDIRGMAECFDNYVVPAGDPSQDITGGVEGTTGMSSISGPQMGTREICSWIGAAAVVDNSPTTIVDYIPVFASPAGRAFAYCENIH